ncbi:protein Spindly-A-like isoform X2 [Amblyomma americanum]
MDEDLHLKVLKLEKDLEQAIKIGNDFLVNNAQLEAELDDTHKRYVVRVEALQQELHSTRMKLECATETAKGLSAELDHAKDQIAKTRKECSLHQAAVKRLEATLAENEGELSHEACLAEKTKLQNQVRRLEEQLYESHQANERLRAHEASLGTSTLGESPHSSQGMREQELHLLVEELQAERADVKRERDSLFVRLDTAEDRLRATLDDLSAQKTLTQNQEDECMQLRAQLESLQMDQLDPKRRGNSLFSEVEDRRLKQEQELLSLRTRYRALEEQKQFLQEQLRQSRNQTAMILAMGSGSKADARQLRLLQESMASATAEIQRLAGALVRQSSELQTLPDDAAADGNPLAGLLKMERRRVQALEEERAVMLKSIAERQLREDRLLRETHAATRKAEAIEAQLLKAAIRKSSEEQASSTDVQGKREVHEHLGIVEKKPPVLREVTPVQANVQAATVNTTDSASSAGSLPEDSAQNMGTKESKTVRTKVTFEEDNARENAELTSDAAGSTKRGPKLRGTLLKPKGGCRDQLVKI